MQNLERWGNLRCFHHLSDKGVHWSTNPAVYSDGRLKTWIGSLEKIQGIHDADLVLSDNLAGVLEVRPDTVLMGSFLWSDVLDEAYAEHREVADFVSWERDLLSRYRPCMLCVGAMAMPGVLHRTQAVPLSWMRTTEDRPDIFLDRPVKIRPRATILIGTTGLMDAMIGDVVTDLLQRGIDVALPKSLYERYRDRSGVSLFSYGRRDFLACDFALCRPGLGAIHDCIFHGLPMVLVQETKNTELSHNGNRIEELQLGLYLGRLQHPGEIAERTLAFLASSAFGGIRKRMAEIHMEGIDQAAQWLKDHLLEKGNDKF